MCTRPATLSTHIYIHSAAASNQASSPGLSGFLIVDLGQPGTNVIVNHSVRARSKSSAAAGITGVSSTGEPCSGHRNRNSSEDDIYTSSGSDDVLQHSLQQSVMSTGSRPASSRNGSKSTNISSPICHKDSIGRTGKCIHVCCFIPHKLSFTSMLSVCCK